MTAAPVLLENLADVAQYAFLTADILPFIAGQTQV